MSDFGKHEEGKKVYDDRRHHCTILVLRLDRGQCAGWGKTTNYLKVPKLRY